MPVATVAAVRQIPQISCCATNPALSNKDSYPYFLRTVPPDSLQARALWHWILQFQVPLAACLYSAEGYGQGLYDALKELARGEGEQDRVQGQALRNMLPGGLIDFLLFTPEFQEWLVDSFFRGVEID